MPSEAITEVNEDLAAEIGQAVDEVVTEEKVIGEEVTDDRETDVSTGTAETTETETTEEGTTETTGVVEAETTEVTGEVETEVTDETVGDETTPKISDEVLTRAVQAGIPLADARMFPSEKSLVSVASQMDNARQQYEEDLRASREAEAEESKPTEKKDLFAGLGKLDPDTYEPEIIKYFEGLKEIVQQQQETIEGFQGRQDETSRTTEVANSREVKKWFNEQTANLGEDFYEALGTGDYASLSQGSPQYANRERLADQVSVLLSGYEATGQEAPPRDEVFRSAARLVFADEYQKIREGKLAGDLEKQASQHIQRAGGQKGTSKESPMEEAARLIDERYPS